MEAWQNCKVKTARSVRERHSSCENVPGNAAWMIDAMALLQSLGTIPATFADLAMKAFDVATAAFLSGSVRIDFVVDG